LPDSARDTTVLAPGREIPDRWWELFHCAALDAVLRSAIASSPTLASARATLAGSQEAIIEARSALYPRADLAASARRQKTDSSPPVNLFSLGPTVAYTFDLFGQTRRQVEEARAEAEERRFELAAAYLTLTGNAVSQAITIASTRLEIATVEDLIGNDERNVDLTTRAFRAGRVAKADVLTAQAQLEADRTELPTLHQSLAAARHALSILSGKMPAEWTPPDFAIADLELPRELPVSLPSVLVRQRPDILAAEANLHADSAAIGVATAEMYPQITLSASIVGQAAAIADLFRTASRIAAADADLDAPLARGGALAAQRRAAIDAYEAQGEIYRQTVLVAFGQVADVLSSIENDNALVAASRQSVSIAQASVQLQRSSYAAGRTSALQLIVAQDVYSQARLGSVRAEGQRLQDTAQLFVALGGGWWNREDLASPAR
jgi:NodT family efflux transporter outer membrane factor (OMF) lipoprotein